MIASDKELLTRALVALGPYLDDIVVVGGWGHRLLALHPRAQRPRHDPLMTEDADLAVDDGLQARGARIDERLAVDFETRYSFDDPLHRDKGPPVCRYVPKIAGSDFYLEFIAPLRGSVVKRGSADITVDVAGASAQRLRYVDLLLEDPWVVNVSAAAGYPVGPGVGVSVRVPNPTAYIVQKLLVLPRRPLERGKDILYLHDTLVLFGAAVAELGAIWKRIAERLPEKGARQLQAVRAAHCTVVTEATREAAAIARASGRSPVPSPQQIADVLRFGMEQVFGAAVAVGKTRT